MINKNTFGKRKSDICLSEELERMNNPKITKKMSGLFRSMDILLKDTYSSTDHISVILKEYYILRLEQLGIDDEKIVSYAKNSINARINDWRKRMLEIQK